MGKKDEYRFNLRFDETDEMHRLVVKYLNSCGHNKAKYIVRAFLAYWKMSGKSLLSYVFPEIDAEQLLPEAKPENDKKTAVVAKASDAGNDNGTYMVDMYLADKLFASIKSGARLVLLGDKDQIESVGPGKVFQEIIDSGVFPVTVLDECFRQEGNSTISQNAIKINKNQLDLVSDDTFQFIPASTPEEASRKIQKIYRKEVLQRNGSLEEVQVMSPLRKDTEAGTDALNLVLRDIANPKRFGYPEITNGRNTYREGDRVMQTKNNDEVANGDIGEVIGIFRKDQKMVMRVDFGDGRVMEYQEEDYWPLTLAYAITVHKAQGSEYPMAILPMLPCFRWMLRRNIFYTAVTRARERFIIVGSKRAIAQAIRTDYISRRNTMFGYRIRKIYEAILEQEKSA